MGFGDAHIGEGLSYAWLAAGVSTAGLLSMVVLGDWGRRHSAYFSAFAVGFLLAAVLFHIAPEALAKSMGAWRWMLAGLFGMLLVRLILGASITRTDVAKNLAFGYASILALGTHSLLDGVIYVTSFKVGTSTGLLATLGLILHEFPEGVIAFFLLRATNMPLLAAGFWAFVAASLTTVGGAIVTAFFIEKAANMPLSALLGLTAGALSYIVLFHLMPHARFTPKRRGYLVAGIGVAIALAAVIFREASGL